MEEALLEEEDVDPKKRDDWEEVQNYIKAINAAIEQLETLPISNRLLKNAHEILMQGFQGDTKLPGEFRRSQNWVGVSLKNAIFIPPHHAEVEELMADLESFLHDEENRVPHLIKLGIAHYQFEAIHPFLDGNGRLGRLMIALYFASFNLLHKPALYLSDFFERNKTEYIDRLMAVRKANQIDQWLVFFLHGIVETAERSIQVFKDIIILKQNIERDVLPRFSTRRQENAQTLMRYLYRHPVVNIKVVTNLLEVKTNTASALIADFVKHGVLVELTGKQRNRLFLFNDYVVAFRNEGSEEYN